jgi:hypothetical protein
MTPEQALNSALQSDLGEVLIIGIDQDGNHFARSSKMDRKSALWLVKWAESWITNDEN